MTVLLMSIALPVMAQTPPWFDVPIVAGSAGGYFTCITRPTGDARIAIITCDPGKLNWYPPFAQKFLIAHEHGHVYQIVYNPSILYGPYAEYDADCYGAVVMANTDVNALSQTVQWFETVLGNQGGDATHGNGFQMAQRIRQCAGSVGVTIGNREIENQGADAPEYSATFSPKQRSSSSDISSVAHGQTKTPKAVKPDWVVSHGPDDPTDHGTPSLCTALEILIDSMHSSFWEASTHVGVIRDDVKRALGGDCNTESNRSSVVCTVDKSNATTTKPLRERVEACLPGAEWVKTCEGAICNEASFRHPGDPSDHPVITVVSSAGQERLQLSRSAATPHDHDGPGLKPSPRPPTIEVPKSLQPGSPACGA
jgi:hypothetical protein